MDCFPPCKTCTGLCKPQSPVRSVTRKPRVEYTDRLAGNLLKCGHLVDPPPAVRMTSFVADSRIPIVLLSMVKDVWCRDCGKWVPLAKDRKPAKPRKVKTDPNQISLLDIPPY